MLMVRWKYIVDSSCFGCAWCFGKSIRGRGSLNFAFLHLSRDLALVFFFAKARPSPSLLRHRVVL
jgi:hypothetical protein